MDDPPGAERPGGAPGVRLLSVVGAAVLLGVALWHPAFRHAEGHLTGRAVLPLGVAAALCVAGAAAGTQWWRAARWLALAIAGQAAALQLMRAGMMVGYQHYVPVTGLAAREHAPALAVLLIQLSAVAGAARGRVRAWLGSVRGMLGGWRLAGVAAVFVLTSATLSQQPAVYASELVLASLLQMLNLGAVVLAVLALPAGAVGRLSVGVDRVLGRYDGAAQPGGVDGFAAVAALWVLVLCGLLARFSYQAHPHVPDEVVYLYHARYFARGMLDMPLPPVPAAFELDLMTYEATRWYSPVPPGWPAVLAVGVVLGVPWLVNPLLNALNVLLAYVLFRELYDRRTARTGVVLLSVSPWFLFMGMNLMTHTLTLLSALGAAVAVARLRRGGTLAWAVPGGMAIGMVGMIRPLEGLTVAVLLGLWVLGRLPWDGTRLLRVATLAVVAIALGALTLPYNAYLAGDPLTFPLMAYTDSVYGTGTNALGFGANRGLGWPGLDPLPGHGFLDVLINGNLNAYGVNVELLGWSTGSLLPIALLVATRRLSRPDVWLLIAAGAIVGVHSLYWFSGGPDFGARYWYLVLVPCIGLTARAVQVVADALAAERRADVVHTRTQLLAGTLALAAAAVLCFIPWRATDKYFHYRNMRPDVRRLAATHEFGRSVVLVRGRRHPDYASAAIYNPLDLHANAPVYVWDRDPAITRAALEAYIDRPVWILDGPTRTGAGYNVVAGPLRAPDLLNEEVAP